ncbi:hypothetical protein K466DRAFT_599161 [Polyporus arcularius HHB13444]|uniref:Uncharacterized protein n=1 Tax=Polyporus arcularius HHB13444 TaxID=1314778 RepID=A0A5C3PFM9_9APHY|nr:hypothetical protein K466DRAFT_599161 [Polyporus arcularius HHB13444]
MNPCAPPNTPQDATRTECRTDPLTSLGLPTLPVFVGDLFNPLYIQVMPSGIPASSWTSDESSGVIDVFTAVKPPIAPVRTGMHVELAPYPLADPLYHAVPAALLFGRVLSIHDTAAEHRVVLVISLQVMIEDRYVLVIIDRNYARCFARDGYFGLIENIPSAPAAALNKLLMRCAQGVPSPTLHAISDERVTPTPQNEICGMVCADPDSPPIEIVDGVNTAFHGFEVDEDEVATYGEECTCAEGGIWNIGKLWV